MSMRHQHFKMSRRWTTLLLAVGLCLTATSQMESRLTCRRYTTQDGLPQMQTERIWQDSRGYIYIGTLSGFVRFDGREFTPFLKGRRENIVGFTEADGVVRALGFRRLWLTGYDHVEMKPIDPEGRWLLNNFNAGSLPEGYVLLEDEQEENRRLCEVTDDGFRPVLKGALLDLMTPDRELYIDSTGIYVPTERGLYRVTDGKRAIRLTAKNDFFTLLRTGEGLLAFAADGNYTRMVTFQGEDIIFQGLGRLEKTLDPSTFVRADRSTVVNIHNISRLDARERLCTFRSPDGTEVETTLLLPAFKRLKEIL